MPLSARFSNYLGVSQDSPWGPPAFNMGIDALAPRAPKSLGLLDFGAISVPNATAMAATPVNWTVTPIGAVNNNSIVANPSNGYLLVTPGDANNTGYNLQGLKTSGIVTDSLQQTGAPVAVVGSISDGVSMFWGARMAISCTGSWNGAMFLGFAIADTGVMTAATGALDSLANGVGFYFAPTGVITLVSLRASTPFSLTLPVTVNSIKHTSSSFRRNDFHDFFFVANWKGGTAGANGNFKAYFDGRHVGTYDAAGNTLPNIVTASVLNSTIEVLTDTSALGTDCTLAVSSLLTGSYRPHLYPITI